MASIASLPATLGAAIWSLVTSVRFAVVQIAVIVSAALVGMIVHQIPAYAIGPNATAADYAREMAKLHAEYDPALGKLVTGFFEQAGFFRVFTTPWFTALLALLFISITACTLDRLPRLWAEVRSVHVRQPDPYFDPRLPGRARFEPLFETDGAAGTGWTVAAAAAVGRASVGAGTPGGRVGATVAYAAAVDDADATDPRVRATIVGTAAGATSLAHPIGLGPDPRGPAAGATGAGGTARPWSTEAVRRVLRSKHFRLREETAGDATFLYGDRNQYTKLATLITHLGLLLFIVAAAVTANGIPFLGLYPAEIPIVLAQDQTQTIQPIGTPNLLVVKNLGFSAPVDAQGHPLDFTTDLAIYQNGVLVARKTIRVNDPLNYDGYSFHQNFTGPALDLDVKDNAGNPLWSGPLPLDDPPVGGNAAKRWVVPGRDVVLDLVLLNSQGSNVLVVTGSRQTGVDSTGQPVLQPSFVQVMQPGQTLNETSDAFTFDFTGVSAYTGLIARSDPGEYIVWFAFGFLILGLLITFYLPRRRVWLRLDAAGGLAVVGRSDRYVAFDREFRSLLEALATVRPEPAGRVPVRSTEPAAAEAAGEPNATEPDIAEPARAG